ncbi:hypothetical protein TRFO_05044 [Tritrichomonas foetus]|uniref:Mediator of RNA polymerase II transcription subunit 14 n=1 Tax=Tritrichomonas foetus TaxID=1144522 RepID=A0A1J4KAJ0_9EUKA|nr:hypothetical protein TRFO_05044 [Tritrichomonas foetus]|eukprot:OHT07928.1 hypothetical protein TRFO_05044 [Tritrichomonas foetus]
MDKSMPIELANLVHRFASFSFNELEKLLDESSGEEAQKRSLMRNLHMIYTLGVKVHMAVMFDMKYRNSKELFVYLHNSSFYEQYLDQFAALLFEHRRYLEDNILSMYDIRGAIDLLLDNCHSRLPRSIFPKPPSFTQDPRPYYRMINDLLKSKLLTTRVPTQFQVRFNRGRVILSIPDKYKLFLSIKTQNGPFVASKLLYTMPRFTMINEISDHSLVLQRVENNNIRMRFDTSSSLLQRGFDIYSKFIISQAAANAVLNGVNHIISKNEDSLYDVDAFIQKSICVFEFQRLYIEARRLEIATSRSIHFESMNCFNFKFWDTSFQLMLNRNGISIFFEGNNIGEAIGMSFDHILGMCKRRCSLRLLSLLQTSIEGVIHDDTKVPHLKVALCTIIVEPFNGRYHVNEHPELDWMLVKTSTHKMFMKIISDEQSSEIALNHVKGDSKST